MQEQKRFLVLIEIKERFDPGSFVSNNCANIHCNFNFFVSEIESF